MKVIICENEFADMVSEYTEYIINTACECMKEQNVDGQICIMFTDEKGIRDLNRDFRNMDKVTDVLSFPSNDLEGIIGDELPDNLEKDDETGEIILGDIAVCVKRAQEQAEEYGHSLKRELCFLTAHGCLHIMGYDHMDEQEEAVMIQQQKTILSKLGVER